MWLTDIWPTDIGQQTSGQQTSVNRHLANGQFANCHLANRHFASMHINISHLSVFADTDSYDQIILPTSHFFEFSCWPNLFRPNVFRPKTWSFNVSFFSSGMKLIFTQISWIQFVCTLNRAKGIEIGLEQAPFVLFFFLIWTIEISLECARPQKCFHIWN